MCGSCYDEILDVLYAEETFSHENAEIQAIRLRRHAFRIWDEYPTMLPPFDKAGDANTLENQFRYLLQPRTWTKAQGVRRSIGEFHKAEATIRELRDAFGQDFVDQYLKDAN